MPSVSVSVTVETRFGDRVVIVGSSDALGAWRPWHGTDIWTDETTYPVWSGNVQLDQNDFDALQRGNLEFKFVVLQPHGAVLWEPGSNRSTTAEALDRSKKHCAPMIFGDTSHSSVHVCEDENKTKDSESWTRRESDESTCPSNRDGLCTSKVHEETSPRESSESLDLSPLEPESFQNPAASSGSRSELKLRSGASRLQKSGGLACEDACCFGSHILGVADGVSSMAEFVSYGVDAAAFSAELMEIAEHSATNSDILEKVDEPVSARAARAVEAAEAKATTYGASTITFLTLSGDTAGVANLGDSGFMLLRAKPWGMEIIQRSREQQHSWNCPYQLTRLPPLLAERYKSWKFDSVKDCQLYDVKVEQDDLLLLYTDGFSDNLHRFEMIKVINDTIAAQSFSTPPEAIAEALANAAYERSIDSRAKTPFMLEAQKQGKVFYGGKQDDITVVAAWVVA
eukprot:TRINITY_DN5241_c0_g1_i4.p1 TRINITY_DN5241_c0_g1~~TRINITY_DN5241_c0_g1_i4.p1  ORF type:complete len:456 (-),score=72.00 TRINITY_DN5241_c0_g1_i4:187-1554(-)